MDTPTSSGRQEKEEQAFREKEHEEVLVSVVSSLFRKESIKYKGKEPPPNTTKKWIYIYRHPLDGLKQMQAQRAFRVMEYLPPEKRVMTAVTRNNAWLVEELAITGHPCEIKNAIHIKELLTRALSQESGYTPLHIAASFNFFECVEVLLAVGCDVNATTNLGFTPLYVAVSVGANQAAMLLREAGGVLELPKKELPGVRTIVDIPLPKVHRVVDDRANNLGRRPYVGQF